jgi:hypothetical protein
VTLVGGDIVPLGTAPTVTGQELKEDRSDSQYDPDALRLAELV